jgi:hypothetical protein
LAFDLGNIVIIEPDAPTNMVNREQPLVRIFCAEVGIMDADAVIDSV